MDLGNVIVCLILSYQTMYVYNVLFTSDKKIIQDKNKQLDSIREIKVKTLEEQKKFIDLKYPKSKFVFSQKWLTKILFAAIIYTIIYQFFNFIFKILNIKINLGWSIAIAFLLPICITILLKKYNLQQNTLLDILK